MMWIVVSVILAVVVIFLLGFIVGSFSKSLSGLLEKLLLGNTIIIQPSPNEFREIKPKRERKQLRGKDDENL